ncbi:MAG: alkaline phosphatase [Saprospiraceae bacterium]|nr:alkaline phosphatase [Saprospiraceae bacterium]MBP7699760.1 alkaline phosphatase [Saprospiraceae bacterium]
MIGDGMGMSAISAAMYRNGSKLNLERFPITGIHKSNASSHLVTDSAAGATAFSCGCKTYNGSIGMNKDTLPCKTILEEAIQHGLATGMVATSTIVHATPAAFVAHQKDRNMYEEIANDFLNVPIDIFIGGGKKFFDRRQDNRNLITALQKKGYTIFDYTQEEISQIKIPKGKKFGYFTADKDPLPVVQGRDYLPQATMKTINYLHESNGNGFFAMIEGSQIDWGGHANKADYIISEMLEFDIVIGQVLDWAARNGETLVIVTADHETGGFAIQPESTQDSIIAAFTTTGHTAEMIPVFAFGPGANQFSGIYENTAIHTKMKKILGW